MVKLKCVIGVHYIETNCRKTQSRGVGIVTGYNASRSQNTVWSDNRQCIMLIFKTLCKCYWVHAASELIQIHCQLVF